MTVEFLQRLERAGEMREVNDQAKSKGFQSAGAVQKTPDAGWITVSKQSKAVN